VKRIIDDWFSSEIKRLKKIIGYWRNYYNRSYNVDDMVNDVYIHAIKNICIISCISDLEAIVFNYIKENSYWRMSSINKDYKTDKEYSTQGRIEYDGYIYSDDDLSDKIKLEMRINYLYDFRNSLCDAEERVYFTRWIEILQDGEKPSTRRMKEEFGIKHYQSANLSKDLLGRLNEFLIKNNYKNE
jgi:hypothetical protein